MTRVSFFHILPAPPLISTLDYSPTSSLAQIELCGFRQEKLQNTTSKMAKAYSVNAYCFSRHFMARFGVWSSSGFWNIWPQGRFCENKTASENVDFMRPPLGAPVGLLWDPQVTHRKPKSYANESQGNPKAGQARPKVNIWGKCLVFENNFWPLRRGFIYEKRRLFRLYFAGKLPKRERELCWRRF